MLLHEAKERGSTRQRGSAQSLPRCLVLQQLLPLRTDIHTVSSRSFLTAKSVDNSIFRWITISTEPACGAGDGQWRMIKNGKCRREDSARFLIEHFHVHW